MFSNAQRNGVLFTGVQPRRQFPTPFALPYASLGLIFGLLLWGCAATPAFASVVTFDDLDATAGDISLDGISPYQGFIWVNFSAYTSTPGFPGFNNGIVSSPNGAYTAGDALGTPIVSTITAADTFNFVSAEFGAGWYDGLNVTVQGFLGGSMLFNQTVTVDTEGAQLFLFNFTGIDQLAFFSTVTGSTTDPFGCGVAGCSQITLDDLTFTAASSAVPEPSKIGLTLLPLSALLVTFRKRRPVG